MACTLEEIPARQQTSANQKKAGRPANERPESREETPKEGTRQRSHDLAALHKIGIAAHKIQGLINIA